MFLTCSHLFPGTLAPSVSKLGSQVSVLVTTTVNPLAKSFKVPIDTSNSRLNILVHLHDVVLSGHELELDIGDTGVNLDQMLGLAVHDMLNNCMVLSNLKILISTKQQRKV